MYMSRVTMYLLRVMIHMSRVTTPSILVQCPSLVESQKDELSVENLLKTTIDRLKVSVVHLDALGCHGSALFQLACHFHSIWVGVCLFYFLVGILQHVLYNLIWEVCPVENVSEVIYCLNLFRIFNSSARSRGNIAILLIKSIFWQSVYFKSSTLIKSKHVYTRKMFQSYLFSYFY